MARHCQLISPDHGLLSTDHIRTISMLSTTTIHPDRVIGSTHDNTVVELWCNMHGSWAQCCVTSWLQNNASFGMLSHKPYTPSIRYYLTFPTAQRS